MAVLSDYVSGTITLTNGSVDFTGTDTGWQLAQIREGDTIFYLPGTAFQGVISEITSNVAGKLDRAWEGPDLADAPYRIRILSDGSRATSQSAMLREQLGNGNIQALAGLTGSNQQVPMFTGPGAMTLVPKGDFINGVAVDKRVNNLAERAAYDSQAEGFSVYVANVGDGRAATYFKQTAASGDWSSPAYVTGPAVTLDVTEVDEVPYGTPPDVTLTPITGGYNLAFEIPRGMLIEPGTTTTLPPGSPASVDFVPVTGGYRLDISLPKGDTGDIDGVTPFWVTRLSTDTDAEDVLTGLGVTSFWQGRLSADANASAALTGLGFSTFIKTLVDDADAGTFLTSLGFSTFMKSMVDDADAAAARTTLGLEYGYPLIHVVDEKAFGTDGGSAVSGANGRDLNTVRTNNIPGASLATNYVTLPAGTYDVEGEACFAGVDRNLLLLVNVSSGAGLLAGMAGLGTGIAKISGRLVLAAPTTIQMRHYVQTPSATVGLGAGNTIGFANTFAQLKFWKLK